MNQLVNQLPKKHKIFITSLLVFVMLMILTPSDKANASRDPALNEAVYAGYTDKHAQKEAPSVQNEQPTVQTVVQIPIQMPIETPAKPSNISIDVNKDPNALEIGRSYALKVDLSTIEEPEQQRSKADSLRWQMKKVKNGDNLAILFQRAGFSAQTLYKITSLGKSTKVLTKIHPGQILSFGSDTKGNLQQLIYSPDKLSTLYVTLGDDNRFSARKDVKSIETRQQFAAAKITSSFWNAGMESGLSESQIMNLANIFGWDIDFANDIRDGDAFSVVFEDKYIDGEFVENGTIIAAEFINQGDEYQAVRYKDGEYYSPSGRSMRKAFLRAPVNFKYVSSNFKRNRFHPVLKRWKAHRGVDYAAKTGTPVVAAGSGKVIQSGYGKYNGNHVFIQHPGGIVTKYLHFSKRKVKKGARVKQGDLIGLVGTTGRSSGPHLHFEFIVNGVHRNPRTVKMPKARPIAKKEKSAFLKVAATSMTLLQSNKRVMLAYTEADVAATK
jgi:murein DD-endopeptidase MepM/ murein hydrolase activator NlpD